MGKLIAVVTRAALSSAVPLPVLAGWDNLSEERDDRVPIRANVANTRGR